MADEKTTTTKESTTQKPDDKSDHKQVPAGGEVLKIDNPQAGVGSIGNTKKPYRF